MKKCSVSSGKARVLESRSDLKLWCRLEWTNKSHKLQSFKNDWECRTSHRIKNDTFTVICTVVLCHDRVRCANVTYNRVCSYQMDSDVRRASEPRTRNPSSATDPMAALYTSGLEIENLLNGINLVVQPNDRFAQ